MKDAERLIFAAAYVSYYDVDGSFGSTVGAVQQAVRMVDSLRTVSKGINNLQLNDHESKMLAEFYEGFSDNPPAL
jgi:hypothetical protein